MDNQRKILKLYGAYSLTYRGHDGEWVSRRLSAQTHSKALAEHIYDAIESLPIKDRTKDAVNALAQSHLDDSFKDPQKPT